MSRQGVEVYAPIEHAHAVRLLVDTSGIEADEATSAIATLVGCEPPALRWAGTLARATGWRPLQRRLETWELLPSLVGEGRLPWRDEIEAIVASLPGGAATLLSMLAACDAPFAWDVLDRIAPGASIESLCLLEDAGLLDRSTRAGVVMFAVRYCVRSAVRSAHPERANACAIRWLEAWAERAEALQRTSYGVNARATLVELGAAVPLAERALLDDLPAARALGLALWTNVSDAMFFGGSIDFASSAFGRAVEIADGGGSLESRVRTRLAAGRASLERGEPERAASLLQEAERLAEANGRDDLRSETLRGLGWAALASAQLNLARTSFDEAYSASEARSDPRGQADATAGRGVLSLLAGDAEAAHTQLAEALAIHVVTRDAPREEAVRGMMDLLPQSLRHGEAVDADGLARQMDELRANGQRWREALVLARLGLAARARGDLEAEKVHLREARAAAALARVPASNLVRTLIDEQVATSDSATIVGFEGRTIRLPSGELHDLRRHGPVRKMLWALATARHRQPGVAMSTLDLVEAGWPGEKMKHEAATLRVYTTIRRLRLLGLEGALITRDDGYLLDQDVRVVLEDA